MTHPTEPTDDDATRPMKRTTLPDFQTFNPRIRIIGVPVAQLPGPPTPPREVERVQSWEAALGANHAPAPTDTPVPVVPVPVVNAPAAVAEVAPHVETATESPVASGEPVSVRAIMDVGDASVSAAEPPLSVVEDIAQANAPERDGSATPTGPRESGVDVVPPATDSDSGVRGLVTSAPELSSLDWDDREMRTDVIASPDDVSSAGLGAPSQALRWDEDEVTVPRHDGELRAQAHAIAAADGGSPGDVERGPSGTLVDEKKRDARTVDLGTIDANTVVDQHGANEIAQRAERDVDTEAHTLVGRGDTLVDTEPPSELARASDSDPESVLTEPPIEAPTEPQGTDLPAPFSKNNPPDDAAEPAAPNTQPSTPPPARSQWNRSIDIDLADLALNSARGPELPSLLEEDDVALTPPPRAVRMPSTAPDLLHQPSFPPVTVDEHDDGTRASTPPKPRTRGGFYALAAALTVCVGILAFVLYPKTGSLEVRLTAPEGGAVAKAEIFVDGQKRCDTNPCILDGIAPGTHVVKVVVPGRSSPAEATVTVAATERAHVNVRLPDLEESPVAPPAEDTAPGKLGLELDVLTDGARVVLVEGRDLRVLPGPWPRTVELAPGTYKVVASRYGYAPFSRRFTVRAGDGVEPVRIELERDTASSKKADADADSEPEAKRALAASDAPTAAPEASSTGPAASAGLDSDDDIYE